MVINVCHGIEYSTKDFIVDHLREHIDKGNFNARKRRDNDNIEMTPKSNIKLFRIKKDLSK